MAILTSKTTLDERPSAADLVHMVKKSDTTDNAAGTSHPMTVANFIGRIHLETITNSSAGEFDFASIPAGFNRLIIKGRVESNDAGLTLDTMYCYLNEDVTNSNYYMTRSSVSDTSIGVSESATPSVAFIAAANAIGQSIFEMEIEGYAGSELKGMRSTASHYRVAGSQTNSNVFDTWHDSMTAAITRLRFRTDNHSTDQLLGTLHLYGEM